MRRRFQFSLRALLVLMFGVACFFGGIHFERAQRRRADEATAKKYPNQYQRQLSEQQSLLDQMNK